MRRGLFLCAGLALLTGCGTVSSYASGCGGPYSGLRHDGDLLGTYGAEMWAAREFRFGADGWIADTWDSLVVALDLPFSAVADTLVAPIGLVRGQRIPEPVGLGCRFAAPNALWGSVAAREPDDVQPEPSPVLEPAVSRSAAR
jgi:uncharacterized protein YceK